MMRTAGRQRASQSAIFGGHGTAAICPPHPRTWSRLRPGAARGTVREVSQFHSSTCCPMAPPGRRRHDAPPETHRGGSGAARCPPKTRPSMAIQRSFRDECASSSFHVMTFASPIAGYETAREIRVPAQGEVEQLARCVKGAAARQSKVRSSVQKGGQIITPIASNSFIIFRDSQATYKKHNQSIPSARRGGTKCVSPGLGLERCPIARHPLKSVDRAVQVLRFHVTRGRNELTEALAKVDKTDDRRAQRPRQAGE